MKISWDQIRELEQQKLVKISAHKSQKLFLLNYTDSCQYDRQWTPLLLMCRGLVVDETGVVKARPFPKFFNIEEHNGATPSESFTVTHKMDGSLGITYTDPEDGLTKIATRGSFYSDQAIKATQLLHSKYNAKHLYNWQTYLFEIVYPQNRIVIDYGNREELILLGIVETQTGIETPYNELRWHWPDVVDSIECESFDSLKIKALIKNGSEGFVIRWDKKNEIPFRLKVKSDEYFRLHKIITGFNESRVWEALKEGEDIYKSIEGIPDEFHKQISASVERFRSKFKEVEDKAQQVFTGINQKSNSSWTRRDFAFAIIEQEEFPAILFKMLDTKPYDDLIWKMLKPIQPEDK